MTLDLTSLSSALGALEHALADAAWVETAAGARATLAETIRSGVVQSYEVAYEQCWKMIRRWLRENGVPEDADHPRTRKELFRLAAEAGLVDDPVRWFAYGDARNLTSHTYDGETAERVVAEAVRFLPDARALLARLEDAG